MASDPRRPSRHVRQRGPRTDSEQAAAEQDSVTRQEVSRVIGSARRGLQAMRMLFIADAFIIALLFALALGTESRTFQWITGGLLVVAILGAIFVVRAPVICSVVLALFHTGLAALVVLSGTVSVRAVVIVLMCVMLWRAVAMSRNLQALLRRYPDVWAAKRMRGEGRGSDEMGSKWRDQARQEKAEKRKRILLYFVLPVALAIVGLFAFGGPDEGDSNGAARRPPPTPAEPLQPRLDAFRAAWGGSSAEALRDFFATDLVDRKWRLLSKLFRRREWNERRPPITFQRRDAAVPHQVAIFWDIENESKVMQTDWQWEHDAWWLLDLKLRLPR